MILSSYDGHVYALEAATGKRVWMFPATPMRTQDGMTVGDFSYSSPFHAEGTLYLGNLDGYLYALDVETGTLRWRFKTDGPVTSTPLIESGTAYFGSNDGNVYAVDVRAPRLVWKWATQEWVNSSARFVDVPVVARQDHPFLWAARSP